MTHAYITAGKAMRTWEYNKNVQIDLPEFTLEAFDRFMNDKTLSMFIPKENIKEMRERFKKDFNLKENKK